ncbi:DivIVA domain-containing protein [Virgibacillus sp. YIM 98842]|jgi:DivIVA domain-containing protein|uniref:DivIVA domain-containing protein n=1 Tax=Virgibacillus sp. YIM 98842 TaxID=2663533 RepID=UPI0013DB36BD|nr:DivIVA domain-containing protein [Virgibacillus sp. YIM 98842]
MGKVQVNLSLNDVLETRFRQSFRGYNQDDVDVFLDKVVQDYAAFNKEIDRLEQEVEQLKKGYGYR